MAKKLRTWMGQLWNSLAKGKQPLRNRNSSRLQVELLEDRAVPANFGTVQGFAFLDANNNGIMDARETRLSGVKVTLDADNTPIHVTLATDVNGFFKFTNVPDGGGTIYTLTTVAIPGLTKGAAQTFTGIQITSNNQIVKHNFIYHGGVTSSTVSLRQFLTNSGATSLPFGTPGAGSAIADHTPTVSKAITPVSTTATSANTVVDLAGNFKDLDFTNSVVTFHVTNGKLLSGAIATATASGGLITITTSAAHGLATGAKVTIANVNGFAAANGAFTITVVSSTQFTLNGTNATGSGTGGTWSSLTTTTSTIKMILFDAATPRTVANFFDYILSNAWDHSVFHRNAKVSSGGIGVLQGGAVKVTGDNTSTTLSDVSVVPIGSKVPNEFLATHSNILGTIAMAQTSGDINSATNQFFFNSANNAAALDTQKFAVFGKVADTASLNALKALAATSTKDVSKLNGAITTATGNGTDPITITSATAHGLATGAQVTISNVAGFTAANGTFTITVISPTQFTLNDTNAAGNGTGGTWLSNTASTFANAHSSVLGNAFPLTGYSGTNGSTALFPSDAGIDSYMQITDISVNKRDEFLTYSLVGANGGGDPVIATATITNEYLTIHPLSAGTTTFKIQATDRYGATVTTTVSVTVTGNKAPTLDLNGGAVGNDAAVTFTEGVAQPIAPAGTITDTDSTNLTKLTATLTNQPDGGGFESLSLSAAAQAAAAGLAVNYNPSTGVMTITGSATVSTYQTILRGILYNNSSTSPNTANRIVTVVVNDGSADSATRTSTIAVVDLPAVSVAVTGTPANEATGTLTFTFTRDLVTASALTVNYTVNGTATQGSDYAALSGTVIIPANQASGTVTVTPINDTLLEGAESVILTITPSATYTLGASNNATGAIADDESATLDMAPTASVTENGGPQPVGVTLSITGSGTGTFALGSGVVLTADVVDALTGIAVSGTDYNAFGTQTVAFNGGDTTGTVQNVTLSPIDNLISDGNRTVNLTLQNLGNAATANAALGNTTNTTTILDNEP